MFTQSDPPLQFNGSKIEQNGGVEYISCEVVGPWLVPGRSLTVP
jgi:hypothetical protein